jgi:Putative addiction module component
MTVESITEEVLRLPKSQRLAIAKFILEIDCYEFDHEIDAAWDHEILARISAVDEGSAVGIPYEEVKRQVSLRFSR